MNEVAEFNSENAVRDILRHTKNLQRTRISVEYDRNEDRQFNKKVMMELKNIILAKSKLHKVSVRNDKLRIENKWFQCNTNKVLCCGKSFGVSPERFLWKLINISTSLRHRFISNSTTRTFLQVFINIRNGECNFPMHIFKKMLLTLIW